MANLLVTTTNMEDRNRLQQDFPSCNQYYLVGKDTTATLQAIFASISFEYFHKQVPLVVQKIIAFAQNSVNNICSLTLLREIIAILKKQQDHHAMYRQYFLDINQQIGENYLNKEDVGLPNQWNSAEQNEKLFDLASRGQMRFTRQLDNTDFKEEFQTSIKVHQALTVSEKTQLPTANSLNPEQKNTVEKIDKINELSHIFDKAEDYYGKQWWKPEKQSDSSKQISKFDCKNSNAFLQKSIGRLVMEQLKYDLNREIELGKQMKKHEQVSGFKYKKMMKDKLLSAKLKKHRKK